MEDEVKRELTSIDQAWRGGGRAGGGTAVGAGGTISGPIGGVMPATTQQYPFGDALAKAADHILIMELIGRGYAVAKLSAQELADVAGGCES